MKVAIIGSTGFVGGATSYTLHMHDIEYVGYHVDDETSATKEQVNECDAAFVCVPTPMSTSGECDTSIVESVVEWLETPLIIIKSTVPIGTTRKLAEKYGKNIVHNPEFLREATAFEDSLNPSFVLVGLNDTEDALDSQLDIAVLLAKIYPNTPTSFVKSEYSEAVKYSINSFLAYKVGFFNELHHIAQAVGLDSDLITKYMLKDPRIGESHTKVTEEGGFGGHCFPKDLNALIDTSVKAGYEPRLFQELWNSNRFYRAEFASEEFNFYE